MAEEPPRSRFAFPSPATADDLGRVAVGGDLEPGTLLAAYRAGLFPMHQPTGELAWWSPDPRCVLEPDALRISGSLRRSCRLYETRVDTAFEAVVAGCADREPSAYDWITPEIRSAYVRLHELGWAHSVETWTLPGQEPAELVGGLYGVCVGGVFAGESMFHRRRDASKVALVALAELLLSDGQPGRLVDVQWQTPHFASLGAVEIARAAYLGRLEQALELPPPPAFA